MNPEEILISCLLSSPSKIGHVAEKIKPEYFTDEKCRLIFETMLNEDMTDIPQLAKRLEGKITLKELIDIDAMINVPCDMRLDGFGWLVLDKFKRREIERLYQSDCENLSSQIAEIERMKYFDEEKEDAMDEYLQNVEDRYNRLEDKRNVPTGFYNIDSKVGGFRKSELIILGGRPASGKTTLGMNIAYQMAKDKHTVLFFSLEMGKVELYERLVTSITKIRNYQEMTSAEFEKIIKVGNAIRERLPLVICDDAGISIEKIAMEIHKHKPDIVFVDHLSILKSVKPFKSRYEEVSYLSMRLKQLARENDIPVVCLCQLNRALENRTIKAPTMADLRDSGSIEQDADLVGFVYRPEYHLKDQEPDDKTSKEYSQWEEEMDKFRGKAFLILQKNRRGYIGRFDFDFDGATYTFKERNNNDESF